MTPGQQSADHLEQTAESPTTEPPLASEDEGGEGICEGVSGLSQALWDQGHLPRDHVPDQAKMRKTGSWWGEFGKGDSETQLLED